MVATVHWDLVASLTYDVTLVGVCAAAVRFGGPDEKVGAAVMLVASGITAALYPLAAALRCHHLVTRPILNIAFLAVMDSVMVRSRKFWPVWMVAAQLAELAFDCAALLSSLQVRPYYLLRGKLGYVQLAAILIGTIKSGQARRPRGAGLV